MATTKPIRQCPEGGFYLNEDVKHELNEMFPDLENCGPHDQGIFR
jgi:hypothetical protein